MWTDAELYAKQFNKIVIGVPGRPFPIMMPNPDATTQADAFRLENIEDPNNPIVLWSKRPYDEVIGMLYRSLPTPSMLPLFYETMQLLQLENDRRIQFYVGKHGSGKSFLGRLVGDMLHPDGAITFNCADRDLNELLFETVLDVGANPDLYTKINDKLRTGTMNPTSVAALKDAVGDAYSEEKGYPYIDFASVGRIHLDPVINEDGQHETEAHFSAGNVQNVMEVIMRITKIEGLSSEASFMPLKSQLGLLPLIWQEGRVAHLEEYNKCKEGTDTCLHPVLQVYNGEYRKCTVYGSGGMSFTFDNHERQPGFFCYLDGNMRADGVATHSLSASANDRLLPNIIQDMIKEDWQHRWCQLLTGIPIKILYESNKAQWAANPEDFTRFLHMIRGLGGVDVPEAHTRYINRWEDVMDATDMMSRYNYVYDQMTNPDSPANRNGEYPELFTEVDEDFYNMAGGSMRRNIYYLKMALLGNPKTLQPSESKGYDLTQSWEEPPPVNPISEHRKPEQKMGTHIVEVLFRDMLRLTLGLGKTNLYMRLRVELENIRMLKPKLHEGAVSDSIYFEDLLNLQESSKDQLLLTQDILCNQLRRQLSGVKLSKDNDHLMTLDQIKMAFQQAISAAPSSKGEPRLSWVFVQNFPPLVTVDNLLKAVAVVDGVRLEDNRAARIPVDDLVEQEQFLLSLALPQVGKHTLDSLWNQNLYQGIDSPILEDDESLKIASNRSTTGVAFTTCLTQINGKLAPVHLVWDLHSNDLMAVGEIADEQVVEYLKQNGIEFFDRNASNAKTNIRFYLNRLVAKRSPLIEKLLVGAFLYRNTFEDLDLAGDPEAFDRVSIADLLTATDCVYRFPNYITRLQSEEELAGYLAQTLTENAVGV
ncbi:MAG: hypothetical protein H6581_16410 [Bacteroidia bacterium]|nr:hypothetical protein [Bacteroidia bacterium]